MFFVRETGFELGRVRHSLWCRLGLICVALSLGSVRPALAADFSDEDLLFGGMDLISEVGFEELDTPPEEVLLTADGVKIGGRYSLSVGSTKSLGDKDSEKLETDLQGTFYIDARPEKDYRVFAKAKLSYPFLTKPADEFGQGGRSFYDIVRITELFSDFNHKEKVFFRAGKQTINWGVGYFFSPADIVNLTPIDPEDPEAEREGPLSLKANLPLDANNLYLYVIADEATKMSELALAPKAEIVVGPTEIGLGAYYQRDRVPMAMSTISSALGDLAVFGELVCKYGSDKRFVRRTVKTPENPLGVEIYDRKDEVFLSGTGGFRYSHVDDQGLYDLTLAAQYLYNGEGYEDPQEILEVAPALLFQKQLSLSDLAWSGKHYGASTLVWHDALETGVTASLFWLGSLRDGSGRVTGSLSWEPLNRVSTSLGLSHYYGAEGREFTPMGNETSVFFRVTLGSGQF